MWEEVDRTEFILWTPRRTYSSVFSSPDSKCPRLCCIYCKFGEQLLALCWWAGQVSSTEPPCNWLLPRVLPPRNWYLACWESNTVTSSQFVIPGKPLSLSHTLHPRGAALEGFSWLQPVARFLKHHCFFRDNQGRELTWPGWDSSDGCGHW